MIAIILAKAGPLRDSLQAFLLTLPQIETVRLAGDASAVLRTVAEQAPALLLADASVPGNGVVRALSQINVQGSKIRILVLADDRGQQRAAAAAGADVVLLKGFPAAKLFQIIERLLSEQAVGRFGAVKKERSCSHD